MITITPTSGSVLNNPLGNRMQMQPNQRFPHPGRQNFFQPFRAYRQGGTGPVVFDPEFDGKRLRKSAMRKTVDYNASIIKMLESRVWQRDYRDHRALQPDAMYIPDLMPPSHYQDNPINSVTTRFVKTATNKMRCPIFCMAWTPEGRRLVTGASSGEFTLWNGLTFNFETILQAHDSPVRTMVWSHNEMWMVTADHAGFVKYWQSNMNNVKMFMAHQEAIRGISFSPLDSKFASCSDDGTIKIWDFYRCQEERALRGHGADVKCVHWHPHKGLIISGSKDNQQPVKLWDPKSGTSLATIHAHKSTVMDVKWNNNGNWFVTASRDHLLKLFDIRNLNVEVQVFRGHKKESSSVAWHPVHEGLFCSGGSDGAILFWHVGADKEVGAIEQAHDSIVWTLAWHPMGHILCSGSNDHTSKFWTRNRPGDSMRDKYNLNTLPASLSGVEETETEDVVAVIPGMGPDDRVDMKEDTPTLPGLSTGSIPGLEDLDLIIVEDKSKAQSKKVPYSKPIPKNFQAQWNDTGKIDDLDDDDKDGVDPIALLNQLIEQQPGAILLKDLQDVEAIHIYGKTLTIRPESNLSKAISEGTDKLLKYLHSGAVKDMRDVIPYYENMEIVDTDDEEGCKHPLKEHDFGPLQELIDKQKEQLANARTLSHCIPADMEYDNYDDETSWRNDGCYYDDPPPPPEEDPWEEDNYPRKGNRNNGPYRDFRDRDRPNRGGRGRDRGRDRGPNRDWSDRRGGGRHREMRRDSPQYDDSMLMDDQDGPPFRDRRKDNFDGPLGRDGPMVRDGPMGGNGPMGRDGPLGGNGPIGRDGPMVGGPMGGGPMSRDGPMGGLGPMGSGSMGRDGPMVGGPMGGGQMGAGPMGRDGPMVGGLMGRDGPMGGGPMGRDGPMGGGPMGRDGPMGGGPMGRDGPMGGGPMGGQMGAGHIVGGPMGREGSIGGSGPIGRDGPLLTDPQNFNDGPPSGQGGFLPSRGGFHGNRGSHNTGGGFGGPSMMNMFQNSQDPGPFGLGNGPPMHMGPNSRGGPDMDNRRFFNQEEEWNEDDPNNPQDNGYNHFKDQQQGHPRGGFRGGRGFRGRRGGPWRGRGGRGLFQV